MKLETYIFGYEMQKTTEEINAWHQEKQAADFVR